PGPQPHAATAAGSNTYSYDLNGNMTNRTGTAMAYDQENRLVQAGSYTYTYNYKGMRAVKNGGTPTSTTAYLNNLYECTNGTCTKHIFAGSQRIASKNSAGTNYYHPDHLGGLNVSTNSAGGTFSPNFYYPYGEDWISGSDGLHYKFTDQEKDSETGNGSTPPLYYYKARYYDPQLGRFTSPDPLLQAAYDPATSARLPVYQYLPSLPPVYSTTRAGANSLDSAGAKSINSRVGDKAAELYSALNINAYAYSLNNPITFVD